MSTGILNLNPDVPAGMGPQAFVPAFRDIIGLLSIIAGHPLNEERAILLIDPVVITDTAAVLIDEAQDVSRTWSLMLLQFTRASGDLRYDITGGYPTAAGRGVQIPAGGGTLYIRQAENIRAFKVIGETGQAGNVSGFLFTSPIFRGVQQ